MDEFLRVENISKKFGNVYANENISFSIQKGEVHTVFGENGAGKSTLMNILIGLYQPTDGKIYMEGVPVKITTPKEAVKLGIGMVHQHFMLVEAMTVFENIILGTHKDTSIFIKKKQIRRELEEISKKYGLQVDLDKLVSEISVGEQQRVEILKTLYRGAKLLILDEPTAVLTDIEVVGLFQIIHRLIVEGKSVIFISHKMREVMEISNRITVLRSGRSIITVKKEETTEKELVRWMMGRELKVGRYQKVTKASEQVLNFQNVSYHKKSKHNGLSDISLSIQKGEILGIAGVDGNGQSQLAMVATGVVAPEEGNIILHGKKMKKISPHCFIKKGVSHIPEDRNRMGLIGNMNVKDNLLLKSLEKEKFSNAHGWWLKKKAIREEAEKLQEKYDIRCASIEQQTRNLSGGNQQKIILAREIENQPELLVAVHPTRGLDVGATEYVHDEIVKARDRGCGILLISADFEEVLKLSDRIAVMYEGKIAGIYSGENPPVEKISMQMSGKNEVG